MGCLSTDTDAPQTIASVRAAGYVDASLNGKEVNNDPKRVGILVTGLHNYGDSVYESPEGTLVYWARLGY
jgi:hypothetical protein